MPAGKIAKIVHLTLQSSFSTESSPAPKGYGYIQPDDETTPVYFDSKAVKSYSFDDLQVGQAVEFDQDPKLPIAKSVTLSGNVLSPPSPQIDLA